MAKKSLRQRAKKIKLTARAKGGYISSDGVEFTQAQGVKLLMEKKATLSEWHGGKKKDAVSYEGGQYRGGKKKGRKNLKKLENGNLQNQYGVEFTQADKKALESAVNTANRKRTKMLENEGNLTVFEGGKPTDRKVSSLQVLGKESDFILARKSKSLQRFKSREEFENYLENVRRVSSPKYLEERTRLYKRNHMKAIENVFGDDAKDVVMKIRMMKPEEYREMIQKDETLEVSYIYDPGEASRRLNIIREALGMKPKEDYMEGY